MKRMDSMGVQSLEADIATVAASFGAVLPPGASFPVADFRDGVMSIKNETVSQSGASKVTKFTFLAIIQGLHELNPQTEDHINRKQELLDVLPQLLLSCDELAVEIIETRRAVVEEELWKIREQCDAQSKVVAKLSADERAADLELRNIIDERDSTQGVLQNLREQEQKGQHIRKWATKAELAAWNSRVGAVKQQAREILERMAQSTQTIPYIQQDLRQAVQKMKQLEYAEARLRREQKGDNGYDAEFGLQMKPAGYVTTD